MFVNVWWFILLIICSEVTGISKNISPHTWGYTQVQTFYIKNTDRNKVLLKLLRLCCTLWNKFTRFIFKTLWDVLFRFEIDTRCGRSWNNLHFRIFQNTVEHWIFQKQVLLPVRIRTFSTGSYSAGSIEAVWDGT